VQSFPYTTDFSAEAGPAYAARPASFVYAGVVAETRGVRTMITALEAVPTASLDLAGVISPPGLQAELAEMPAWRRVRYHGQLQRDDLARLLCSARAGLVVLQPTRAFVDGLPVKLLEYMAAGLPVVVSDFPRWRSIVEPAGCGLLVDPRSAPAVAAAMRWILENPAEAAAMGQRGRASIEARFNWSTEEAALLGFYANLVNT
jgi:glycosyltransferase involved in cell wall biosynthesis